MKEWLVSPSWHLYFHLPFIVSLSCEFCTLLFLTFTKFNYIWSLILFCIAFFFPELAFVLFLVLHAETCIFCYISQWCCCWKLTEIISFDIKTPYCYWVFAHPAEFSFSFEDFLIVCFLALALLISLLYFIFSILFFTIKTISITNSTYL